MRFGNNSRHPYHTYSDTRPGFTRCGLGVFFVVAVCTISYLTSPCNIKVGVISVGFLLGHKTEISYHIGEGHHSTDPISDMLFQLGPLLVSGVLDIDRQALF